MKKMIALLLAAAMLSGLAACGNSGADTAEEATESTASTEEAEAA